MGLVHHRQYGKKAPAHFTASSEVPMCRHALVSRVQGWSPCTLKWSMRCHLQRHAIQMLLILTTTFNRNSTKSLLLDTSI